MAAAEIWGELVFRDADEKVTSAVALTGNQFVIGRGIGCNYHVFSKMISSRHCFLERDDLQNIWICDTSTNGTVVNGKRITKQQRVQVSDGDKIYLVFNPKRPDQNVSFVVKLISESEGDSTLENIEVTNDTPLNSQTNEVDMVTSNEDLNLGESSTNTTNNKTAVEREKEHLLSSCNDQNEHLKKIENTSCPYYVNPQGGSSQPSDNFEKNNKGYKFLALLKAALENSDVLQEEKNINCPDDGPQVSNETAKAEQKSNEPPTKLQKLSYMDDAATRPIDLSAQSEKNDAESTSEDPHLDPSTDVNPELEMSTDEEPPLVTSTNEISQIETSTDESRLLETSTGKNPQIEMLTDEKPQLETSTDENPQPDSSTDSADLKDIPKDLSEKDNSKAEESKDTCKVTDVKETLKKAEEKDEMADTLTCSLCLEILYDPVSLAPCNHSYCAGCYSQWMSQSKQCPQCRLAVKSVTKNHLIGNMVEVYLKKNPDKQRSEDDIKYLKSQDTITEDKNSKKLNKKMPRRRRQLPPPASPSHVPLQHNYPRPVICRQCPGSTPVQPGTSCSKKGKKKQSKKRKASNNDSNDSQLAQPGTSKDGVSLDSQNSQVHICSPQQNHVACMCCYELMPNRDSERITNPSILPQECELCKQKFCHMYWGCRKVGCLGCLNKFKDMNFGGDSMLKIINKNEFESKILLDYLSSKNLTWMDFLNECLDRLSQTGSTQNISSDTVVCFKCGLDYFSILAYSYRHDIPSAQLPVSVTSRPDCYWGKNCRTQSHKFSHAMRYNHICDQSRTTS